MSPQPFNKAPRLDADNLREILEYCEATGEFTWKFRSDVRPQWNGRYAGKRAGYEWTASGGGRYRSIRIFDWPFPEHRLAHLYMTGEWPQHVVDHRDLDGTNNAWINLRAATRSQNSANSRHWKNNKLGIKGVCLCKRTGKYRATIFMDGKQNVIGMFNTPAEAADAYAVASARKSGDFARVK